MNLAFLRVIFYPAKTYGSPEKQNRDNLICQYDHLQMRKGEFDVSYNGNRNGGKNNYEKRRN